MDVDRLHRQIEFLLEIDWLKGVLRRSYVLDGERLENSAEHSWHVTLAAVVLADHATAKVDLERVMKILLVHDVVEVDAGDTFAYDEAGIEHQAEREAKAAERLFALLPPDQEETFRELWREFEAGETSESLFAHAVDRLLPVLHNVKVEGRSWREHGVTSGQVLARCAAAKDVAPAIWEEMKRLVETGVRRGWLQDLKTPADPATRS